MSKPTQIGKLNGQAVYLKKDGLYVEKDNFYLKKMNDVEIAQFIHQELGEKELQEIP